MGIERRAAQPALLTNRLLDAELREIFGNVGPDRLGGREIRIGAGAIALLLRGETAAVKRAGESRIELQCRVVVGDRLVDVAELETNEAAAADGDRISGIDADRIGIVRQRALEVALVPIGVAAVVEGVGEAGIEPD